MSRFFGTTRVLCIVVLSMAGTACDPRCSDGFVELALCEPQPPDAAATPGDDRPGYVTCTDEETGAGETCGPGSGCCGNGSRCATGAEECEPLSWFAACDGPEDCGVDEQCWLDDRSSRCSAEATPSRTVRCHSDFDCPGSPDHPCVNGYCPGDPESLAVSPVD